MSGCYKLCNGCLVSCQAYMGGGNIKKLCNLFDVKPQLLNCGVSLAITSVVPDTTNNVMTVTLDHVQYMRMFNEKLNRFVNRLRRNYNYKPFKIKILPCITTPN